MSRLTSRGDLEKAKNGEEVYFDFVFFFFFQDFFLI